MLKHRWARFGALSSFLVLSLFAVPVFAQAAAPPPGPDLGTLIAQAFSAIADLRTGAVLLGLIVVVNLLVNLTKIPALEGLVPQPWRPVLAVGLGIVGSVLAALGAHQTLQMALSIGIPAGIAAGGGSVALHEAVQTLKAAWGRVLPWLRGERRSIGYAHVRVLLGISLALAVVLSVGACAFLQRAGGAVVACQESDPTTMARLLDALIDLGEEQWLAAVKEIEPNADTAKCDMQGILAAAEQPDGGFSYTLSDGGVVSPARMTSAEALAESGNNRQLARRRAQTYLALTQ